MKTVAAVLALTLSFTAQAKNWGPAEMEEATHAALRQLRVKVGEGAYQNVVEFNAKLRAQKNAANIKITFERGGKQFSQAYFCHVHGGAIDCH